jgi:hypothetical protein
MNMKAIFLIILIVVVIVGGALWAGSAPPDIKTESPVTVYIDDAKFDSNLTDAHALNWGTVSPGNTYTRNFTVVNNQNQPLTLQLFTTEPIGTTQAWAYNNTAINALDTIKGTLSLTLNTIAATGTYTWRLFAINGSMPTVTPTPNPSTAPASDIEFTVTAEAGVQNVTISINTDKITLIVGDFPATFLCKSTDTLTFRTYPDAGYEFNSWLINGITPKSSNPYIMAEIPGNFTIQAKYLLVAP